MAFKEKLFFSVLVVIVVTSLVLVLTESKKKYKAGVSEETDTAVTQAKELFKLKKQAGENFVNGPCLTNDLMADWVVDLVNNPRTPADDKIENQCNAYLEKRAHHFIELDLNGNVISVQ